jgi:polyisoprenyl-phosphate glycosyltransferase
MASETRQKVVILIPVFNDWDCLQVMLPLLDHAVAQNPAEISVLLVDDGSTIPAPANFGRQTCAHIRSVHILHLSRNLGHQRAIAIGLYHIHTHVPCRSVVIMDGDGEDRPEHVARLLDISAHNPGEIVFAARTKRLETLAFRSCYRLYRFLHRILTGISVRVGNFSVLPWDAVATLIVTSDLWSHYAAAVFRSRLPYQSVPLERGRRLRGRSRMNFSALLVHGLSAITVFSDIVSARALAASVGLAVLTVGCIGMGACLHLATGWTVPRWAAYFAAALLFLCLQAVLLATVLAFTILSNRSQTSFIPLRDGRYFIRRKTQIFSSTDGGHQSRIRMVSSK